MSRRVAVVDQHANHEESIERIVKILGRSNNRWDVFEAMYGGGKRPKTVDDVCNKLPRKIPRQSVVNELVTLCDHRLITRADKKAQKAYLKDDFVKANRKEIIRYRNNPDKLKQIKTKRKNLPDIIEEIVVKIPKKFSQIRRLTIDEIDSFRKVRNVDASDAELRGYSEAAFKNGVRNIIGEKAEFRDWGGEKSDLMTTRVIFEGKRISAAFAFKGPGEKAAKLVPAAMGKNGDQVQRLFSEPADLFVVQYWRPIDSSVLELMEALSVAKSVSTQKEVLYCVIDGQDSARIVKAYQEQFETAP